MPDQFSDKAEVARHRIQTAKEDCLAAEHALSGGFLKAANNRAYYCVFHSMRAILALEGKDFSTHGQLIGYFNKNYFHTSEFDPQFFRGIRQIAKARTNSDYNDTFMPSREQTEQLIAQAHSFCGAAEEYLEARIIAQSFPPRGIEPTDDWEMQP